jgi:hypothetical protein
MPITDEQFEQWIDIAFTKPEREWTEEEAYFVDRMPTEDKIACVERIFTAPANSFELLSDEEINRGLWELLGAGIDYMRALVEPGAPWPERKRVLELMPAFFATFMTERCDEHLSHLDRQTQGGRPLNSICYMWWDCMPTWGGDEHPDELHQTLLGCMEQILAIDHMACQENALHGLGHWFAYYPKDVERIIDAYLTRHPHLHEGLRNYARSARCGCVQ